MATDPDDIVIGLVSNNGIAFRCGTCEYMESGKCQNPNPKLTGQRVKPDWCCNLYDHDGMQTIIA